MKMLKRSMGILNVSRIRKVKEKDTQILIINEINITQSEYGRTAQTPFLQVQGLQY